jgi:hypothetical protein
MLDFLVEKKLEEAVSRGELANLPGYVPPEVETLTEIAQLEALVSNGAEDAAARSRAVRKLALLRTRVEARYYEKALAKLSA